MYHYDPNHNHSKRWAALATGIYILLLAAAFLFVSFDMGVELRPGEGLLIDFGTDEAGSGAEDLRMAPVRSAAPDAVSTAKSEPEEVLTDSESEVEVTVPQPTKQPTATAREVPATNPAPTPIVTPAEEPRRVNQRALFPGRTPRSEATSQGTTEGQGNQGHQAGAPGGDPAGTGAGDSGVAYDLSGRSVAGSLPAPLYPGRSSGKVIIDVTVDGSGRVIAASYRSQGSTTNDSQLVNAAREAALRARFSPSERPQQDGTITYIFQLK